MFKVLINPNYHKDYFLFDYEKDISEINKNFKSQKLDNFIKVIQLF